jgi:hypothetical protein
MRRTLRYLAKIADRVERKRARNPATVNYCEIIAANLSKAGWCCGCISSTNHDTKQFWVVATEREDAGRFIVHADEMLTAFRELESLHRAHGEVS